MSFVRRHAVPLAAAIAAAAAAFAVVVVTTDGGGPAGDGGPATARASGGLAVFTRMGCGSCHRLAAAGSTGPVGPNLDERLLDHTRESLTGVILSPAAYSIMPSDFGERMSDAELDALVDFLVAQREPH